jgi:DNA-binding transcriptional LysR family regulator
MNLKPFEAFRAVAVTGSTTAAARSLDVSQSAVSRLVAQLEAALGLDLFRRDRGRLVPTAEARELLDPVTEAIESSPASCGSAPPARC